jgi:hypothetical protein
MIMVRSGDSLAARETFAEITDGAAATLTGLLFVAVSIRIDYIARSRELRNRAAQTLCLFGAVLITAVLLAIPGQAYRTLGLELIVLAVITSVSLYLLDRRAKINRSSEPIARVLEVLAPNQITSVLLLVPGILLALGERAGLYVLIVPMLEALVGGVVNAWLFLTKITDRSEPPGAGRPAVPARRGVPRLAPLR